LKGDKVLKAMVILKGLKNIPKLVAPLNVHVAVSIGGSMNEALMLRWVDKVFKARGPFALTMPSLLILDEFGAYKHESCFGLAWNENKS